VANFWPAESDRLGVIANALQLTGSLSPREDWEAERCSIAKTLGVLNTRSAFLILREAFYGTTRFDDFAHRVGLSPAVTAARLQALTENGLLEHEDYRAPGERTRKGYRLSAQGADLFPVLAALMQWGDRWLAERGGPVRLRHHDCGALVDVRLRCRAGHEVALDELALARGRG
jgi:DNA-binding HxlR family transcriptional regulator